MRREVLNEVIDGLTVYNRRRLHSTLHPVSYTRFKANWHMGDFNKAAQLNGYLLRQTEARSVLAIPLQKTKKLFFLLIGCALKDCLNVFG